MNKWIGHVFFSVMYHYLNSKTIAKGFGEDLAKEVMMSHAKKAHLQRLIIWGAFGYNFKSSFVFFDANSIRNSYFIEDVPGAFGDF
jgi:hypothetical protein